MNAQITLVVLVAYLSSVLGGAGAALASDPVRDRCDERYSEVLRKIYGEAGAKGVEAAVEAASGDFHATVQVVSQSYWSHYLSGLSPLDRRNAEFLLKELRTKTFNAEVQEGKDLDQAFKSNPIGTYLRSEDIRARWRINGI